MVMQGHVFLGPICDGVAHPERQADTLSTHVEAAMQPRPVVFRTL